MKTKISLLVFSVLYYGITFSQTTEKLTVNFATNSYVLEKTEQEKLTALLNRYNQDDIVSLKLEGYTDNSGAYEYNKKLSANRSGAVAEFLKNIGVASSKISTSYFGEETPLETNADENSKARNRRVEIIFLLNNAAVSVENNANPIQPPLPGLERQFQYFTINTAIPCTLTTASGAQIRIPANAFADENGNAVKGDIQVGFRDYYKPLEVFLSGIPMVYDSGGIAYNFETDGMFEIKAEQNDKKLTVAEGTNIDVDVPGTPGSSGFNLYAMQGNGGWNNIGQPGALTNYTAPLSNAWSLYLSSQTFNVFPDTTVFAQRFPDVRYEYLTRRTDKQVEQGTYSGAYNFRLKNAKRFNGDKKGLIKFNIEATASRHAHHEMRNLTKYVWVYDGTYNKKDFAASFLTNNFKYRKHFNDMRLVDSADGIIMQLKGRDGTVSLPVHIYGNWDRKVKDDADKFRKRLPLQASGERKNKAVFAAYTKALQREETTFDLEMNKKKQKELKVWRESGFKSKEDIRNAMSEEEKKMTEDEWLAYVNKVKQSVGMGYQDGDMVVRTVSIRGMGVYNCDRIGELKKPIPIIADCKDPEGKHLASSKIYVLDESLNGISTFTDNKLTVDPNTTRAIISIDKKGNIAYANNSMLQGTVYIRDQKTLITLERLIEQPKNEEEFGKLLGFAGK